MIIQSTTEHNDYLQKYQGIYSYLDYYLREYHGMNLQKLIQDKECPLLIDKTIYHIWKRTYTMNSWITGYLNYREKLDYVFKQEGLNLLIYKAHKDKFSSRLEGLYFDLL